MTNYKALYEELEQRLRALISRMGAIFSESEQQTVIHFVEHGEYGVALETLWAIVIETGKSVSDEHAKEIRSLQERMELKSLPYDDA